MEISRKQEQKKQVQETSTEEQTIQMEKISRIHKILNNRDGFPLKDVQYSTISIAPMLDITNQYFRFMMRLLTRYSTLYTEMIHINTILHFKKGHKELLQYSEIQHPLVLQFGGSDPDRLMQCSMIAEEMGYDEVNLNVGCPSERVQEGSFGACLMKQPQVVCSAMRSMVDKVKIPCTVQCRLGVDDFDTYEFAKEFIERVSVEGGVKHFVVHARQAYLKGLSPLENRNVPPLWYDRVIQLKQDLPHLQFTINGGFKTYQSIQEILKPQNGLAGCMVGRLAYENPWYLRDFDRQFFGLPNPGYSRREILQIYGQFGDYIFQTEPWIKHPTLVKPLISLFANQKGATKYRQLLSDHNNFKAHPKFSLLIKSVIVVMDELNKEALDEKPPI